MSARQKYLQKLGDQARAFYAKEHKEPRAHVRGLYFLGRWSLMVYRKLLEDDVKVRAESLAFLMLFSLLPLITGLFYILTLFTQFGMVQEAISSSIDRLMASFPPDHRTMILEYVLKFKDAYLQSISGKSSTLGVFALLVLVYVGLQTFNNIDKTLNFIWSSENERPLLEKIRNFVVTSVVGPFILVASLSLPIVLRKLPKTRELLENFPAVYSLVNQVIPFALIVTLFVCLYKFVPVRKVSWKACLTGALVAAVFLQLSNVLIATYFKYGTNSAYGKAATIPIVGFWIYLVWVIVILGAEVSYLLQNQKYYLFEGSYHPSLYESECLLATLHFFHRAHKENKNPVRFEQLFKFTRLDPTRLGRLLNFLEEQGFVARTLSTKDDGQIDFVLSRSLDGVKPGLIVHKYMIENRVQAQRSAISGAYEESLRAFTNTLNQIEFANN